MKLRTVNILVWGIAALIILFIPPQTLGKVFVAGLVWAYMMMSDDVLVEVEKHGND